jgi:hypothetical protein
VINILRHQASKNNGQIDEEDLCLCLQIVARQNFSNKAIQSEVKAFYKELQDIGISESSKVGKKSKLFVYFHQLLGPLIIKSNSDKFNSKDEQTI